MTLRATRMFFAVILIALRGIVISEWIGADGKPTPVRSQYTDTWVKLDGRWQVAASHLTNAPKK